MSNKSPIIAVFAGGTSAEREVSLGSGRASALALARFFPTRLFEVNAESLPAGVDPRRHVVFSTLHGTFGEDGGMQRLLDAAGIIYAGCDAASSALTMNKTRTKDAAAARGVRVVPGLTFSAQAKPVAAVLNLFRLLDKLPQLLKELRTISIKRTRTSPSNCLVDGPLLRLPD